MLSDEHDTSAAMPSAKPFACQGVVLMLHSHNSACCRRELLPQPQLLPLLLLLLPLICSSSAVCHSMQEAQIP
jgi:hypothetical protein